MFLWCKEDGWMSVQSRRQRLGFRVFVLWKWVQKPQKRPKNQTDTSRSVFSRDEGMGVFTVRESTRHPHPSSLPFPSGGSKKRIFDYWDVWDPLSNDKYGTCQGIRSQRGTGEPFQNCPEKGTQGGRAHRKTKTSGAQSVLLPPLLTLTGPF